MESLSPKDWAGIESANFPFSSYSFLCALESTGCLGSRTGWVPFYLTAWQGATLVGALMTYLRSNSYGEYIFDFQWAQAYESQGMNYYPKLTAAAPFTPATGPKVLLSPVAPAGTRVRLIAASQELAMKSELSSAHALFTEPQEHQDFLDAGFFLRHSFQYHWLNPGYFDFQDFLGRLRSKRRKEIQRERNQAHSLELKISRLTGDQLEAQHAEAMHRFYTSTVYKMGGYAYLTREFFLQVFETMKSQILFVGAQDPSGAWVAGALNYIGQTTLFGRHWGCLDEFKSLHFELCYYQGIEFAIERKLSLFEAGAQGEHKFQRGFNPRLTYSLHQMADPRMNLAIKNFVEMEKIQLSQMFEKYKEISPYSGDR